MTQRDPLSELRHLLDVTRPMELDCDQFFELMAPWLDGVVESSELLELLAHHRDFCAECAEELALLKQLLSVTGAGD